MHVSFYTNPNFQRQYHLSEQPILKHFKYTYEVNKWSIFGPFRENGSVPYPYKIRKFKDLSRSRNIVSYFHHLLKRVFVIAAAGLITSPSYYETIFYATSQAIWL